MELFFRSAFVDNMALVYFLGICTLLGGSRRVSVAFGLGVAIIAVMGVTVPLNHLIYHQLLVRGSWAFAGMPELDLTHLSLITFIGLIAATVQILEMVLDRFFPKLFRALGIYLPLITVNCAVLGTSLFMVDRRYSLGESVVFALGSGVGWALAVLALAAIRERLHVEDEWRSRAAMFVAVGILSMGFLTLSGVKLP